LWRRVIRIRLIGGRLVRLYRFDWFFRVVWFFGFVRLFRVVWFYRLIRLFRLRRRRSGKKQDSQCRF
jgi:hypothetical protein